VQTQPDWICISKSDSSLTCGITAVSSDCFWFERKWNAWAPNGPSAIWGKNRHSLMVEVFIFFCGACLCPAKWSRAVLAASDCVLRTVEDHTHLPDPLSWNTLPPPRPQIRRSSKRLFSIGLKTGKHIY
jgi:hypothetical protein